MRRAFLLLLLNLFACTAPEATPTSAPNTRSSTISSSTPSPAAAPSASASASTSGSAAMPTSGALRVTAEETRLRIELPDGRVLEQKELVGVILTVQDESNTSRRIRIEKVVTDSQNPDLTMYEVSVEDPATRKFTPFCSPAPDGSQLAFPLAGTWTRDGRHLPSTTQFNMTCTSGAIGKCVRFGYRPWAKRDGVSLWEHHQACVRMLRADYCGDGQAYTRDGTQINLYDSLGIQTPDPGEPSTFEAGWGPDGAVCIHHPRIAENGSLADIEKRCPDRLKGKTGAMCTEEAAKAMKNVRVMNRSAQR
jgi:hypothetical protein